MEHAKKMILLPQASVERLQNTFVHDKIKSVQTPGSVTSRLDAEMSDILNSSTCKDEREKWSLYRQVLQRYLHFKEAETREKEEKSKKNIQTGAKEFSQERSNEVEEDDEEQEKTEDAYIIDSIPPKYKQKAKNLLRGLRAGGLIVWNNLGSVTIDGAVVPGANMVDLINDAVRDRKRSIPVGHLQFATVLRNTAIPREFIGNKRVWRTATNIPPPQPLSASATISGVQTYRTPPQQFQTDSASSDGDTDTSSNKKRKVSPEKRQSWLWSRMTGIE